MRITTLVTLVISSLSLPGCCNLNDFYHGSSSCSGTPSFGNCGGRCMSIGEGASRDLLSEVAAIDDQSIEHQGRQFAAQFSLSDEQGIRVARLAHDFSALENRTEQDLTDFARRLYGVSPAEIAATVEQSNLGNRESMNALVARAAEHFGTDPETMKNIIRELHGRALQDAGIEL